jgi:hypothetical protein
MTDLLVADYSLYARSNHFLMLVVLFCSVFSNFSPYGGEIPCVVLSAAVFIMKFKENSRHRGRLCRVGTGWLI